MMIASDERTKRMRWRYVLFVIVSMFGILSYVIMFDRTKFHELLCTINGQLVSNQFETQKIVWRNKTLLLLGRFANRCNSIEIEINKNVLEDAETFKPRQSKENSIPQRDVVKVNCSGLITGSNATLQEVKQLMTNVKRPPIPDSYFITETTDCHAYRLKRGYILDTMTSEEDNFPIAFSILMFKHVSQVERLLRAIYRPHNYYCIHVDKKASTNISVALHGIANCFSNVFLTSRSVNVTWGTFTVLEPELICMRELWRYRKWKYFINLTGQEFPLKTNFDMVRILKAYNGANDIEATLKRANKDRWVKAGKPPHNIRPVKGSVHIVASRGYVDYLLHNQTSKDLLEWVKKTHIPDETYFSTLNHNPHLGVPGSYKGEPERGSLSRFKNWRRLPCAGKIVRGVCVLGVGDLPLLVKGKQLFANKFHLDFEPYALDCIEEWHYNRTRDEYLGVSKFNNSYYKTLDFVTNKI